MAKLLEVRPYVWEGPYAKWRSDAPHDPGLCADVRAPWMAPDERLIARTCEMIGWPQGYFYDDHFPPAEPEGRGKTYKHIPFQWNASQSPKKLTADCTTPGKGRFTVDLTAEKDYVDINLSLQNGMSAPAGPIDWPFCMIALESPTLRNPEHDRIMIFDGKNLRSFRDVNGKAGIFIVKVAGGQGFIPVVHQSLSKSPVEAQESVVIVKDQAGRHTAALGFEQSYSSLGCIGNMCFHMDPFLGTLKPGETKKIHGRLYLIEGNAQDAFERYRRDFR
jgi:hypothetical protein